MESAVSFADSDGVNGVDGIAAVGNAVVDDVVDVDIGINGVFHGAVNDVVNGVSVDEINPEIRLDQAPRPPTEIVGMLDQTPPISGIDTPNLSFSNDGSGSDTSLCCSDTDSQLKIQRIVS